MLNVQAETLQLQQTGQPMEGSSVPQTEPWRMAYGVDVSAANDVLWKWNKDVIQQYIKQ